MNPNLIGIGRYQTPNCGCGSLDTRDPKTTAYVIGGVFIFAAAFAWFIVSSSKR
jgi:hypothetical protein